MRRTTLLVLVLALAVAVIPLTVKSQYVLQVTDTAMIYAVAVIGLGILLGLTGQMSLAQAAFFGIGAYASALLSIDLGWPFWLSLPVAVLISAAVGLAVGYPCLRLSGHYLALATIGFGIIVQLFFINSKKLTNGPDGLTGIPPPHFGPWTLDAYQTYFYVIYAALVLSVYVAWRIKHSRIGRALEAIRENEIAAQAMGINTTRYKVLAFVLASAFGGLGGGLIAHMTRFISPDSYSFDQSVVFLVMLVIGGSATITGALTGAILLTFLPEMLRPLKESYIMVYGAAVIVMVIFMPDGLIGLLKRFVPAEPALLRAPSGNVDPLVMRPGSPVGGPHAEHGGRGAGGAAPLK
ncbi:MAG: branched-chain amino acid ABC transporter permease [Candidatus Eremiobacteraeota bacterium]|nr:branched-chain amino acid ABC transporter permease [Candidatus Eremiobacteraeota bacterium]